MKDYNNLYLMLIQFGLDRMEEGITKQELVDFLNSKGFQYTGKEYIFNTIFENLFYRNLYKTIKESDNTRYTLKEGAFFDFITYKSYKISIQQAKRANCYSTLALIISTITLVVTGIGIVATFFFR